MALPVGKEAIHGRSYLSKEIYSAQMAQQDQGLRGYRLQQHIMVTWGPPKAALTTLDSPEFCTIYRASAAPNYDGNDAPRSDPTANT
jgi:hypothetical protein